MKQMWKFLLCSPIQMLQSTHLQYVYLCTFDYKLVNTCTIYVQDVLDFSLNAS